MQIVTDSLTEFLCRYVKGPRIPGDHNITCGPLSHPTFVDNAAVLLSYLEEITRVFDLHQTTIDDKTHKNGGWQTTFTPQTHRQPLTTISFGVQ
jgi:hypothetical protein